MCTLQDLLDEHGITHFSVEGDHRILSPVKKGGRGIIEPPEELWPNIIPTLQFADEIRERLDMPVIVVSGYRTKPYNRLRNSDDTSEHVQFKALDLRCADYELLKYVAAEVLDHAAARGIRTGLGVYDESKFIHIDTGSTKARYRRWPRKT